MSDQLANFQQRVKRIEKPKKIYYTDPETGINIPRRLSKHAIKTGGKSAGRGGLFAILMSLALGTICLMAARYVRFHYIDLAEIEASAMALTTIDLAIATFLAMFASAMVRLSAFRCFVAQMAGIATMLVAMHNLIWIYPDQFAQVFSQDYVDMIRATTTPQSLYVNGETFAL